jgi:putative flippase GtrA
MSYMPTIPTQETRRTETRDLGGVSGHAVVKGMGSVDRLIRYCLVGGINTATDLLTFLLLTTELEIAVVLSNVISYSIALCISFVLNRTFTFSSSKFALILPVQFYRFVAINLVSLFGSTAVIWMLAPMMSPIAAKLATVPLVTAWGFFSVRLLVFQPNCARAIKAGKAYWRSSFGIANLQSYNATAEEDVFEFGAKGPGGGSGGDRYPPECA